MDAKTFFCTPLIISSHCTELLKVSILKEVARTLFAIFVILVVRPTVVKQHEFN